MGAKTIVSSGPQVAPRMLSAPHNVTTLPPPTGIFLSSVEVPKPTQFPSGEKKGVWPHSVITSSSPSKRSRERKYKCRLAYFPENTPAACRQGTGKQRCPATVAEVDLLIRSFLDEEVLAEWWHVSTAR